MTASSIAVPLAAAAVLVLLVRTPGAPAPVATLVTAPASEATGEPASDTTFKGGIQVAVIRERAGEQARFTSEVTVAPGDRLRVEVALDREQAILAGVMADDGSWLELMAGGIRSAGTHLSDRAARVDASPLNGAILVGPPEVLAIARASKRLEGVTAIRLVWESP